MKESKYVGKKKPFYKKKQFYNYLIGIFIISIMVLGAINLSSEVGKNIEYNGLKFVESGNGYLAYLEDGESVQILSNPEDLLELELDRIDIGSLDYLQKVYISISPYDNYQSALYDFDRNIDLAPLTVTSCYEDNSLCSDLPIKACEDTSSSIGVIIFKEDNETVLSFKDNCLTIQGKDLLKVTDKLVLDQYG